MVYYEYKNYRKLISDWIKRSKSLRQGGLVSMAEAIDVHPTFLSQVLKETKDFNAEQAVRAATYMKMSGLEKEYFLYLVLGDRAGTVELRQFYKEKKEQILQQRLDLNKRFEGQTLLNDEKRAIFYSSWLYSGIRLLCSKTQGLSIEEICERFDLERNRAVQILDFLCEVGLCRFEKGKYHIGTQHTHVPANSPFVIRHHTNWRLQALHVIDGTNEENFHLTAPMAISKSDFFKVREMLTSFTKDCVEIAKSSDAENLFCLNIDFYEPK